VGHSRPVMGLLYLLLVNMFPVSRIGCLLFVNTIAILYRVRRWRWLVLTWNNSFPAPHLVVRRVNKQLDKVSSIYSCHWMSFRHLFNPLTPNDPYRGRTAPLTSKRCILCIYSTNIGAEYFKHGIYFPFFLSSKCSLFHNSNVFGSCINHILYVYSTNIGTEYFKHCIYFPFFYLQNAVCFIILTIWFLYYSHFIYLFNKYRYWIF